MGRVIIRRQPWRIEFVDPMPGKDGYCDYKNRRIVLSKNPSGHSPLDLAIHEFLHAAFPGVRERVIEEVATDLAAILDKLGYNAGEKVPIFGLVQRHD
jgi:hypothetical protein